MTSKQTPDIPGETHKLPIFIQIILPILARSSQYASKRVWLNSRFKEGTGGPCLGRDKMSARRGITPTT